MQHLDILLCLFSDAADETVRQRRAKAKGRFKRIIATTIEKASKYLVAGLAKNKTIEEINHVTINLLGKVESAYLKTMTSDNGRELCGHDWFGVTVELSRKQSSEKRVMHRK